MSSLVFSASVNVIEFDFVFADGTKAGFTYRAPFSKEIIKEFDEGKTTRDSVLEAKDRFIARLTGDKDKITKMVDEIMEKGNIFEIIGRLDEALVKEKNAKSAS